MQHRIDSFLSSSDIGVRKCAMNTSYPEDADGDVLKAMAESGVDMTQPLTIEFVIDTFDNLNNRDSCGDTAPNKSFLWSHCSE